MMSDNQPTGEATMKKMISVKADIGNYDISVDMEKLDGLPYHECKCLLQHLKDYIAAYQRLRHARQESEVAEQEIAAANLESTKQYYFDDIPF